jgi:hypothetical protein
MRTAATRLAVVGAGLALVGGGAAAAVAAGDAGRATAAGDAGRATAAGDAGRATAAGDAERATAAGDAGRVTAAANRRVAIRDAHKLLGLLVLPAGAVRLTREPRGDGGALRRSATTPATPDLVDVHAWWRVPGSLESVLTSIEANPPAGGKLTSNGSFSGAGYTGLDDTWSLPSIPDVLGTRSLVVTLAQLSDGATGVRADAQDVWIIPRPAGEQIPPGVRVVDVTRGSSLSITVTDPAKVHTIVALIDALPIAQPGAWSCPGFTGSGPFVTFTFLASAGGPVLAHVSQAAWATEPTTPCDPMTFSVHGRAETPLLGGAAVVHKVGQLLGVQLATKLPAL